VDPVTDVSSSDGLPTRRERLANVKGRIEIRIVIAVLIALALMASMFWMAITGNMFCCDPKSLLGQLFTVT
jgi:hypothetical protein